MLSGIMFILLGLFVEMPFWLSIMAIVYGGLRTTVSLIQFGIKLKEE